MMSTGTFMKTIGTVIVIISVFSLLTNKEDSSTKLKIQQQEQDKPLKIQRCLRTLPIGVPKSGGNGMVQICRSAYITNYDLEAKIPVWVAYTLTPEHALGCLARGEFFTEDLSIQEMNRSTRDDYKNSGFDMGHMANAADMAWDSHILKESFYLSNMSPQWPKFNRGVWKTLECAVRASVYYKAHSHSIYVGSIYDNSSKRIGKNEVVVPNAIFKIIVDLIRDEYLAFVIPNREEDLNSDFNVYQTSLTDIENMAGLKLPDKLLKMQEMKSTLPDSKLVEEFHQVKKTHCM